MAMASENTCCGKGLWFEPYPETNFHDMFLVRAYCSERGNHAICIGKCGSNSSCPFCTRKIEIGVVSCAWCGKVLGEGFRVIGDEDFAGHHQGEIWVARVPCPEEEIGPVYSSPIVATIRGED